MSDHHESAHKKNWITCRAKKWRGTTKIFFGALRLTCAPPHFQIRSGATDPNDNNMATALYASFHN